MPDPTQRSCALPALSLPLPHLDKPPRQPRPLTPVRVNSPALPAASTLSSPEWDDLCLAFSILNDRGRLAAAAAITHLDWRAGQPISFAITNRIVVVKRGEHSAIKSRIDARKHLRLPASLRAAAQLRPGETMLLVAARRARVLAVYSSESVHRALRSLLPDIEGLE